MCAAAAAPAVSKHPVRRSARIPGDISADVTVLRFGIPERIPGRILNLSEGGIGLILAAELRPGEIAGIEVALPAAGTLRARAVVRHQASLRCGLQFLALSQQQREAIAAYLDGTPPRRSAPDLMIVKSLTAEAAAPPSSSRGSSARQSLFWAGAVLLLMTAGAGWWQWHHAWQEIESKVPVHVSSAAPAQSIP